MKHIIDDADKNKYEALSKAEVIALLQQVIESGQLPENELKGLVLSLRNQIDNLDYKIAFCSQAKYNELKAAEQLEANCYYFITDDTSYDDINNAINNLNFTLTNSINNLNFTLTNLTNTLNNFMSGFNVDLEYTRDESFHASDLERFYVDLPNDDKGLYCITSMNDVYRDDIQTSIFYLYWETLNGNTTKPTTDRGWEYIPAEHRLYFVVGAGRSDNIKVTRLITM